MIRGVIRVSRNPVFRLRVSSVTPAECENSAAESVVGTAMCGTGGSSKFSERSFTTTLVASIGLPPPRLISESALAAFAALSACAIPLAGACCLISEKTAILFPEDSSILWTRSVLLAMVCPVMTSGFSDLSLSSSERSRAIEPWPKCTRSIGR